MSVKHDPSAASVATPLAVVLAAGRGTRMGSDLPKVVFEAAGRPLVRWVLDALEAAGVRDRIVVVGHRAELVQGALADIPGVSFALQREQRGTGDAVAAAAAAIEDRIRNDPPDTRRPAARTPRAVPSRFAA
jgi:bifunctional UDP-N-acetylglucosamine pyrophosphorylase/glucosamine-1-phosphate N-acetyltransferase